MQKTIILISGKQGSGKTTIGDKLGEVLRKELNHYTKYISFAHTIYQMHDQVLLILAAAGIKRNIVKDGELLQLLGTEWGRGIDEDIWVKCARNRMDKIYNTALNNYQGWADKGEKVTENPNMTFIIDDCRFPNEFDGFPEALRIRLHCPTLIRQNRCSYWRENDTHLSEIALDGHAADGSFDLDLDTSKKSIDECVALILVALHNGDWDLGRK